MACTRPAEAALLLSQVAPYFRRGITLAPGDTVVDVGANIGLFCALAGQWGERAIRGLAFEPVPAVHAALAQNLARHAPGVVALNAALGAEEGELSLHHYPRATVLSTAPAADLHSAATRAAVADQLQHLPHLGRAAARLPTGLRRALVGLGMQLWLRPQTLGCPVRTLSGEIEAHGLARIDLLKIDAERAEWAVLQGLSPAHWPRVRQVVMEVHDLDGRLAAVCALLRAHGFAEPVLAQSAALRPFGIHQLWARRPVA